jgi:hypothetical protein
MPFSNIKQFVPKKLKKIARNAHKKLSLQFAIYKLKKLHSHENITESIVQQLSYGWNNSGWSLSNKAMLNMIKASYSANGTILECGSGLSTLVLGLLHRNNKEINIYALEHNAVWLSKVNKWREKLQLNNITLLHTEIIPYQNYDWYDISNITLPKNINFIICDGPPGTTRGGRYGLIPTIKNYIGDHCTIFLDDTCRLTEKRLIQKWSELDWISFTNIKEESDHSVFSSIIQNKQTSTKPPKLPNKVHLAQQLEPALNVSLK